MVSQARMSIADQNRKFADQERMAVLLAPSKVSVPAMREQENAPFCAGFPPLVSTVDGNRIGVL